MQEAEPFLKILVGSWNVNMQNGDPEGLEQDVCLWLKEMASSMASSSASHGSEAKTELPTATDMPDIIALGFQEWTGFLQWKQPSIEKWATVIEKQLSLVFPKVSFGFFKCIKLVGIVLFVAIRQSPQLMHELSTIEAKEELPTIHIEGCFTGWLALGPLSCGNKGVIALGIDLIITRENDIQSIRITFLSAHLPAHSQNILKRRENYFSIVDQLQLNAIEQVQDTVYLPLPRANRAPCPNPRRSRSLFECDLVFWFGDLNSRLYDPSFFQDKALTSASHDDVTTDLDAESVSNPKPKPDLEPEAEAEAEAEADVESDSTLKPQCDADLEPSRSTDLSDVIPASMYMSPRPNSQQFLSDNQVEPVLASPPAVIQNPLIRDIDIAPLSLPSQFYQLMTACLFERQWARLLHYDQLLNERKYRFSFQEFVEPFLTFPPTYKYKMMTATQAQNHPDKLADGHELDLKNYRTHWPAWTDRILYSVPQTFNINKDKTQAFMTPSGIMVPGRREVACFKVRPVFYNSCASTRHSDHKPVYAYFSLLSVDSIAPPVELPRVPSPIILDRPGLRVLSPIWVKNLGLFFSTFLTLPLSWLLLLLLMIIGIIICLFVLIGLIVGYFSAVQ